jgi:hypothetical protein
VPYPQTSELLDKLYRTVRNWSHGYFLLCLPDEIAISPEYLLPKWQELLTAIAKSDATVEEIKPLLVSFINPKWFEDPDQIEVDLIGYTYSES